MPRPWHDGDEHKLIHEALDQRKAEELAPYVEAALERKEFMAPLADDEIPVFPAYGRTILDPASKT